MRNFLEVLFKNKHTMFLIFIISVLVALLGNIFATPVYESTAKVIVGMGREMALPTTVMNQPLNFYFNRDELVNTQMEILTSRQFIEQALETYAFTNSPGKPFRQVLILYHRQTTQNY